MSQQRLQIQTKVDISSTGKLDDTKCIEKFLNDDYKEEMSISHDQCMVVRASTPRMDNTLWFELNDKLDIMHENEWYRATIKDIDGYSLCVEYQEQSNFCRKWIKDCNQIFKFICQCTKECNSNIHCIAAYGSQTNYSYDEQIVLCHRDNIKFNQIIHQMLLKYIGFNERDAINSAIEFNKEFEKTKERILTQCDSVSALLHYYQAFNQDLSASFNCASDIQSNVSTNALTLGQYITYIKQCNLSKFKNAMKRQQDTIKNIDDAINEKQKIIDELIKEQNGMKMRRNEMMNTMKNIKCTKDKIKENMQTLMDEQKRCVENVKQTAKELKCELIRQKTAFYKLHTMKLIQFEQNYKKWNKEDTIAWIMMIDHHRFSFCFVFFVFFCLFLISFI